MSYRQPAEWMPHDAVWIGFPSDDSLWLEDLEPAQAEVVAFAKAVSAKGAGEKVYLVAAHQEAVETAKKMVDPEIEVICHPFGDIWLRDNAPLFVKEDDKKALALFHFNGWGGKYNLEGDQTIGRDLAKEARLPVLEKDWVLEGGSIDGDGHGLVVTTEECLLNPNRNPDLSREDIAYRLNNDLGYDRILWLKKGLHNDHTDGHVDNLARFVGENHLVLPIATEQDDPNREVYDQAAQIAEDFGVKVTRLPSTGRIMIDDEVVPASYMNFYIGNKVVVVPVYGAKNDDAIIEAIQPLFPDRKVVALPAGHILTGGGSFHCISQQWPA
ncbi:MAG: agmatine deiminase family protein [Zymomonas mobilis]